MNMNLAKYVLENQSAICQSTKKKRRCQLNCQQHLFELREIQPHKFKHTTVKFCPKIPRGNQPTQSTHPQFNRDGIYYTSAFILGVDQKDKKTVQNEEWLEHTRIMRQLTQKNCKVLFPKPNPKHTTCSVCKQKYKNQYYSHISSQKHKRNILKSKYNQQILKLTQNFKDLHPLKEDNLVDPLRNTNSVDGRSDEDVNSASNKSPLNVSQKGQKQISSESASNKSKKNWRRRGRKLKRLQEKVEIQQSSPENIQFQKTEEMAEQQVQSEQFFQLNFEPKVDFYLSQIQEESKENIQQTQKQNFEKSESEKGNQFEKKFDHEENRVQIFQFEQKQQARQFQFEKSIQKQEFLDQEGQEKLEEKDEQIAESLYSIETPKQTPKVPEKQQINSELKVETPKDKNKQGLSHKLNSFMQFEGQKFDEYVKNKGRKKPKQNKKKSQWQQIKQDFSKRLKQYNVKQSKIIVQKQIFPKDEKKGSQNMIKFEDSKQDKEEVQMIQSSQYNLLCTKINQQDPYQDFQLSFQQNSRDASKDKSFKQSAQNNVPEKQKAEKVEKKTPWQIEGLTLSQFVAQKLLIPKVSKQNVVSVQNQPQSPLEQQKSKKSSNSLLQLQNKKVVVIDVDGSEDDSISNRRKENKSEGNNFLKRQSNRSHQFETKFEKKKINLDLFDEENPKPVMEFKRTPQQLFPKAEQTIYRGSLFSAQWENFVKRSKK